MKTLQKTDVFDAWIKSLRDAKARHRIQARLDRVENGNMGDCAAVGNGVSEMRIHYGPGYRLYFIERGKTRIILLAGGTKSGQSRDIKTAITMAEFF
jgi:putative addiction module killer protein